MKKSKPKKIKKTKKQIRKETDVQQIVNHYFYTKGFNLEQIKKDAKKKKIIYSRFTRPAKQLLTLSGSVKKAKAAITRVAEWANSRGLDYAIETVFKKWLELDRLKPKEIVKKPYYNNDPMVWSESKRKWYVVTPEAEWLEYAGREEEIDWRIAK
ncbi:MAG: hypothetical protein WC514_02410 [Candidatus Paceibacterota bacterium]